MVGVGLRKEKNVLAAAATTTRNMPRHQDRSVKAGISGSSKLETDARTSA